MPRPKNTEQRRAEIVQGLLQVMAERGFERASVAEVARAAGLTPGLVHYHFKNKLAILLALLDLLADGLHERLERRLARVDDPDRRLKAFVDVHLARGEDADERAVACWVAIAAEAIRQEEVREAFGRALARDLELLEELVRAALRERGRPTRPARRIAAAVLASIQGCFVLAAAAPELIPTGSAASSVRRMLEGLLDA